MIQLALLVTLSVAVSAGAPPKVLKSWQEPLPEEISNVVNGIETVTGQKPGVTAEVQDVSAEGQKPAYQASLSLTDGDFSLPVGSVALTLPAEAETILTYIEGATKSKPELGLSMSFVAATPAAPANPQASAS